MAKTPPKTVKGEAYVESALGDQDPPYLSAYASVSELPSAASVAAESMRLLEGTVVTLDGSGGRYMSYRSTAWRAQ